MSPEVPAALCAPGGRPRGPPHGHFSVPAALHSSFCSWDRARVSGYLPHGALRALSRCGAPPPDDPALEKEEGEDGAVEVGEIPGFGGAGAQAVCRGGRGARVLLSEGQSPREPLACGSGLCSRGWWLPPAPLTLIWPQNISLSCIPFLWGSLELGENRLTSGPVVH